MEKKYNCLDCGSEFKRQDSLKKNISQNRCKQPFCSFCYRICDGLCDLRKNLSQAVAQRERDPPSKSEGVEFSEEDADDDGDDDWKQRVVGKVLSKIKALKS